MDLCREAELVWGKELCFDATQAHADAAGVMENVPVRVLLWRVRVRRKLQVWFKPLFAEANAWPVMRRRRSEGAGKVNIRDSQWAPALPVYDAAAELMRIPSRH